MAEGVGGGIDTRRALRSAGRGLCCTEDMLLSVVSLSWVGRRVCSAGRGQAACLIQGGRKSCRRRRDGSVVRRSGQEIWDVGSFSCAMQRGSLAATTPAAAPHHGPIGPAPISTGAQQRDLRGLLPWCAQFALSLWPPSAILAPTQIDAVDWEQAASPAGQADDQRRRRLWSPALSLTPV